MLTIIKLFAGECHYPAMKETHRLAKRMGRMYPNYFVNPQASIDNTVSQKLYGALIEQGYLDFSGVMTEKLFRVFDKIKSEEPAKLDLPIEYQSHNAYVLKKLYGIYHKLIIQPSESLKIGHSVLWQWIGTRGRKKEYPGSELESVLNAEKELEEHTTTLKNV